MSETGERVLFMILLIISILLVFIALCAILGGAIISAAILITFAIPLMIWVLAYIVSDF